MYRALGWGKTCVSRKANLILIVLNSKGTLIQQVKEWTFGSNMAEDDW